MTNITLHLVISFSLYLLRSVCFVVFSLRILMDSSEVRVLSLLSWWKVMEHVLRVHVFSVEKVFLLKYLRKQSIIIKYRCVEIVVD